MDFSRGRLIAGGAASLLATFAGRPGVARAATGGGSASTTYASIARLLGVEARHAGRGLTFDIGAVYPETGPGAVYSSHLADVPKLAFKHIAAMGGPTFELVLKDNKSGDAGAGVQAVRELGFAHVPMMLSSYAADLGAMLAGIKQYKILSIDGSGGAPIFTQGSPYYWGSIAISPTDALPGMIRFINKRFPTKQPKTVSFIGWDIGTSGDKVAADAARYFTDANMTLGVDERSRIGSTDYSSNLQKIKASEPDFVCAVIYGQDLGYFLKQYALAGIDKPVVAFTHSISAQQIAGAAYENLFFVFDYFDAARPANPWAEFFVREFYALEGPRFPPDFYAANTYEDIFTFWDCIRRVLARGGDPHDGAQLDAAFRAKPTFASLYGGDARHAGEIVFDPHTHSVKKRPMTVGQWKGGRVVPLAHFDIGGGNFTFVAARA